MDTTTTEAQRPRLFKRYTNRKFYDPDLSRYVNLGEIAEAIKAGSDVRVLDNRTARDLTGVTLARILSREQKASRASLGTLVDLIRRDRIRIAEPPEGVEVPSLERDRATSELRVDTPHLRPAQRDGSGAPVAGAGKGARAGASSPSPEGPPNGILQHLADPARPGWPERFVEALLSEAHRSAWSARATATASLATVGHLHREARQRARDASEVLVSLARLKHELIRMTRRIDALYERLCELDEP